MNTTHTHHYENDNGQICCVKHAGAYLTASIAQKPNARSYRTPLGTWRKMTDETVAYFKKEFGYACESCPKA